ncbi:hypothetical protein JV197_12765, partial [Vibrio furnissii]
VDIRVLDHFVVG